MPSKLRYLLLLSLGAALPGCASFETCDTPCDQSHELTAQLAQCNKDRTELAAENAALEASDLDLTKQDQVLTGQKTGLERANAVLQARAISRKAEYDLLATSLDQDVANKQIKIVQSRNAVTLEISDQVLFDTSNADLRPEGKALLLKMGSIFSKTDKMVRVIGHTDDVQYAQSDSDNNNWSLSVDRAVTVVRFLHTQAGVDPSHLMAAGRGRWMPLVPNDSPENRQKNRRIEISLVDRYVGDGVQ